MVVKRYTANINIHEPKNYFERFYAEVWQTNLSPVISAFPSAVADLVKADLAAYNIALVYNHDANYYEVSYPTQEDYLVFLLKYS